MKQCPAITSKGEPCQGYVHPGKEFCPSHDPARAEARKRAASLAGRSRQGGEIAQIKATLKQLAEDVLKRRVSPGIGSVANQVYGTLLKCIEIEVRARDVVVRERELEEIRLPEFRELQSEVQELREMLETQASSTKRGGSAW